MLALGLNYAVTSRVPEIIAATETTAMHLPPKAADKLRSGVSITLQSAKLPPNNLSGHLGKATRDLRKAPLRYCQWIGVHGDGDHA